MPKVSVLIPSRNERFLPQTVSDILANARGDIEVIAVLDGYTPNPPLPEHPNLILLQRGHSMGMRAAINGAAAIAKGEYLVKCDAHCAFDEGFDVTLLENIEKDWIVIPRRKRLDAENWCIQDVGKPDVDYHYLSCPITNPDNYSMHGAVWNARGKERSDPRYDIDETPSFQGSFWMMHRDHFFKFLGGMSEEGYGTFCQEPQEIGMKTWLGGGRVMVNKKTWYAHLHKGRKYGRGYPQGKEEIKAGHEWSARYWMNNRWADRIHDIEWFVERFHPMPTWTENWTAFRNEHMPTANPRNP